MSGMGVPIKSGAPRRRFARRAGSYPTFVFEFPGKEDVWAFWTTGGIALGRVQKALLKSSTIDVLSPVSGPVPAGTFAPTVGAKPVIVPAASLIHEHLRITRIGEWLQVRNWTQLVEHHTALRDEQQKAAARAGNVAASADDD